MDRTKNNEWLSVAELQVYLGGLGKTKTYELIQYGEIPSYRIGRVIRVRRQDVDTWLENNRYEPGI